MKNISKYYFAILAPLAILFASAELGYIGPKNLVLFFLFYLIVYRTYIDGMRLAAKNLISKKEIWKLMLPGSRSGYIRELYFDTEVEKK
ncbi:hypothetical protein [Salinimicrobium sp. GXAS 041]|uniref:hypothetical protein n=1 Tax=Salinimicrobium sp. GXAS 041 TaxID=3400806 RepID=UPI003C7665FB